MPRNRAHRLRASSPYASRKKQGSWKASSAAIRDLNHRGFVPTCKCVRACVRPCMHACVCACVHACVRACICACIRACVHLCMCACVHACVHACVCARVRACVHVRVCMSAVCKRPLVARAHQPVPVRVYVPGHQLHRPVWEGERQHRLPVHKQRYRDVQHKPPHENPVQSTGHDHGSVCPDWHHSGNQIHFLFSESEKVREQQIDVSPLTVACSLTKTLGLGGQEWLEQVRASVGSWERTQRANGAFELV